MADYIKKLLSDLPEQFRDKMNIKALNEVIGKQLQDVNDFYEELNTKRHLQTAEGLQLDRIGDIVALTRAEAGQIVGLDDGNIMDDPNYRNILGYKIMLNTGNATYYDIVRGIRRFFNVYPIKYYESPEMPAAFILEIDAKDQDTILLYNVLPVKAAGVGTYYQFRFEQIIEVSDVFSPYAYNVPHCGTIVCGTYPGRATKGHSSDHSVVTEGDIVGHLYSVTVCGTRPERATQGSARDFLVEIKKESGEYVYSTVVCGTEPERATLGKEGEELTVTVGSEVKAYSYDSEVCGVKPDIATLFGEQSSSAETGVTLSVYTSSPVRCGTKRCGQNKKGGR